MVRCQLVRVSYVPVSPSSWVLEHKVVITQALDHTEGSCTPWGKLRSNALARIAQDVGIKNKVPLTYCYRLPVPVIVGLLGLPRFLLVISGEIECVM